MSEGSPKSSPTASKSFTSPELFFRVILLNMKNKPDVDWVVVAEKAGYKSGESARVRFNQLMNKHLSDGGRNPLTGLSSKGLEGKMKSQTIIGKNPFPSRVTKSKPVQRRSKKVKVERDPIHSEGSEEMEQKLGGFHNSFGLEPDFM